MKILQFNRHYVLLHTIKTRSSSQIKTVFMLLNCHGWFASNAWCVHSTEILAAQSEVLVSQQKVCVRCTSVNCAVIGLKMCLPWWLLSLISLLTLQHTQTRAWSSTDHKHPDVRMHVYTATVRDTHTHTNFYSRSDTHAGMQTHTA